MSPDYYSEIAQRLRRQGFRLTPQRLSILRAALSLPDHPTAEEVYQEARRWIPTVSMTTVYHTLETLVEIRAFVQIGPYSDTRRYDKNVDEHVHVVCSRCDQIIDLPALEPETLPGIQESTGFRGLKRIHAFVGVCPKCQTP